MGKIEISEETARNLGLLPAELSSEKRIVVLHRGWVVVGDYREDGEYVTVKNASVIRRWGTTEGLGELALKGPLEDTVLDKCGTVRVNKLAVVFTLDCDKSQW